MFYSFDQDKANHFLYGAVITSAACFLVDPTQALELCAAVAVAKEVFDKVSKRGTPEVLDAVATIAGGVAVVAPMVFA